MRTISILLAASMATACGGGSRSTTGSGGGEETTAGDETVALEPPHPIRTTTPIPVPQPGVSRDDMSPALQRVWDLVEAAVAIRPPEPPSDGSLEGVNQWAAGPFTEWLVRRGQATGEAQDAIAPLEEAPSHERGVAATLIGYLQETTCADVRGAPIPEVISSDAELLRVYDTALHDALVPFARVSVQAYRFCGAAFEEEGDPSWSEWIDYCAERAADVAEVFGLESTETGGGPGATEQTEE